MKTLKLESVQKSYQGQPVLSGFSMMIPQGGCVAVLGTSGAGKTILLRLLLGLTKPDKGSVDTQGARFSCVFQEDRLCPGLSAVANVRLVLPRAMWDEVPGALLALGLFEEDIHKPARALSGGQQRRVALARAVLAESDALVLDEAFKGLDEENREKAMRYVLENRRGRTLLLVTHAPEEAAALGAETVLLSSAEKNEKQGEETLAP